MILTPGLDFINVLRTAFTLVVPQSVRTQSSCQYLFTLLGPMSVKAVRRTLMKLTPGVNFINVFCTQFSYTFVQKIHNYEFDEIDTLTKWTSPFFKLLQEFAWTTNRSPVQTAKDWQRRYAIYRLENEICK